MALKTHIESNLGKIAQDFRSLDQRANDKLRALNIRAGRQLLGVARGNVHVRTGQLRDNLRIEGPFDIVTGSFELRIVANVPQAQLEVDRGGLHDYASRTIADGESIVNQTAVDMETALVLLIEGEG